MIVKNRERAMRTKVVDRLREVISTANFATLHRKDFARTMDIGHNTVDNWKRNGLIVIDDENNVHLSDTLKLWDSFGKNDPELNHLEVSPAQVLIGPKIVPPVQPKFPSQDDAHKKSSSIVRQYIRDKARKAAISAVKDILLEEADVEKKNGNYRLQAEILEDLVLLEANFDSFWKVE